VAYAVTRGLDPPRVLVVGDGQGAVALGDALAAEGLASTVLGPARLPGRLSALADWDVLALVDVPAAALGFEQQAAVAAFAERLGRGVLLTGGHQSFLAGGWANTALADIAPVDLQPPPREARDPVALVLMIDQSASMGSSEGAAGLSKLALAREAATLATEVLRAGDRVGVVAYDDTAHWLVDLTAIGEGQAPSQLAAALGGLASGGGTHIGGALELALPALSALDLRTRHAVLLTDGRDFTVDPAAYEAAVRSARDRGVTLSTIALGADADRELLARLASAGRGRFHAVDDPTDLPRVTVQESEAVQSRSEQHGRFRASAPNPAHPLLGGLDLAGLPELIGYLATQARPAADVALMAPNGDPLLAAWQLGAGRVAAWTSDTGEAWAERWALEPAARRFWARLARYLAPTTDPGDLEVAVRPEASAPGRARLRLDALDPQGAPIDLADASALISDTAAAGGLALAQVAPGRYEASVSAPEGAYGGLVALGGAGPERRTPFGWAPPAVPPAPADPAGALARLAAAGGGRIVPEGAAGGPARPPLALGPWLLVLAALLWPLDVALQLGLRPRRPRRLKEPRAVQPQRSLP
jgi:Mg-chelatase subunit ChlD